MTQINSAIALPKEDKKYKISVQIADKEIDTGEPKFVKGSYNRFNF